MPNSTTDPKQITLYDLIASGNSTLYRAGMGALKEIQRENAKKYAAEAASRANEEDKRQALAFGIKV